MEGRPRTAVNASCVPFNFCVICSYNTDFSVIFATDFSGLRIIFPDKFGDCLVLLHILKAFTLWAEFANAVSKNSMPWKDRVFVEIADESKEGPEYILGPFNTGDWF